MLCIHVGEEKTQKIAAERLTISRKTKTGRNARDKKIILSMTFYHVNNK